jgi:asparagine synthase (glutamine-hydrolysing)
MCGILTVLDIEGDSAGLRDKALTLAKRLRHRGPDWSGIYADAHAILAHERLAIVDIEHGAQPLIDKTRGTVLSVNGEIYNHRHLRAGLEREHDFQTSSDCEVILYLYDERGPDFLNDMNGIFAFVLYDPAKRTHLIARDPIGVVPLYWGWDDVGRLYVASEMKALIDVCRKVEEFPPGHYCLGHERKLVRYYNPAWYDTKRVPAEPFCPDTLRTGLEKAVERQLMCDVPYGLLISGGLDSSVIAALAARF